MSYTNSSTDTGILGVPPPYIITFFSQIKNYCIPADTYSDIRSHYNVHIFYELFNYKQLVHLSSFAVIVKRNRLNTAAIYTDI